MIKLDKTTAGTLSPYSLSQGLTRQAIPYSFIHNFFSLSSRCFFVHELLFLSTLWEYPIIQKRIERCFIIQLSKINLHLFLMIESQNIFHNFFEKLLKNDFFLKVFISIEVWFKTYNFFEKPLKNPSLFSFKKLIECLSIRSIFITFCFILENYFLNYSKKFSILFSSSFWSLDDIE